MSKSAIPAPVLSELQRQLNHELTAAHAYQALSLWCAARTLKGFAAFFAKQAGEEREHAEKIMDHLLDRGVQPELAALPQPAQAFASLLAVAQQARTMEQANTRGINAVFEAALAAKDYPAQVLMHWFINEQVEEEAWCAELIDRVESSTCAGSLSDLDRHIVKLLAGDEKD
ncbi:MAG: ferritin [Opitutae bacterium]|nr:ferritin [Opitutae bacterium]